MSKFIYKGSLNEKYISGTILSDNVEANELSVNTIDSSRDDINVLKNVSITGDLTVQGDLNAEIDLSTITTNTITSERDNIDIEKNINTNGINNTGTITSTGNISTPNIKLDNSSQKVKVKYNNNWNDYICDGPGTYIGMTGSGKSSEIFNNYTDNFAYGHNSTAAGLGTITSQFSEFVIGTYNIDERRLETNKLFVIGNGEDDKNRNDVFFVKSTGECENNGSLTLNSGNNKIKLNPSDNSIKISSDDGTSWTNYSSGGGVGEIYYVGGVEKGEIFNDYSTTQASGAYSHAEGSGTQATANMTHAEGYYTKAGGLSSHAEGTGANQFITYNGNNYRFGCADGDFSHKEGNN